MRKDVAKNFYNASKTVCKLFLYQKLVHVSEICVNHSYARQILSKKSNSTDVFSHAPFGRMLTEKFLCQVKLQTTVNKCVFARYAVQ